MKKTITTLSVLFLFSCVSVRDNMINNGYVQETKNILSRYDKFNKAKYYEHASMRNVFGDRGLMTIYAIRSEDGKKYARITFNYIGSSWIFFNRVIIVDAQGNNLNLNIDESKKKNDIMSGMVSESIDMPIDFENIKIIEKIFSINKNISIRLSGKYSQEYDVMNNDYINAMCEMIEYYEKSL